MFKFKILLKKFHARAKLYNSSQQFEKSKSTSNEREFEVIRVNEPEMKRRGETVELPSGEKNNLQTFRVHG